eukprot:5007412-Pyramimonas_sp.AAC.1
MELASQLTNEDCRSDSGHPSGLVERPAAILNFWDPSDVSGKSGAYSTFLAFSWIIPRTGG